MSNADEDCERSCHRSNQNCHYGIDSGSTADGKDFRSSLFESIKKIVETEKEAQRIKEEASKKAKSILERVEQTKENRRVYFKGQLENRITSLKKEQKEANKQQIVNIKVASEEKVRKINSGLNENMNKAVEKVFEEIIKI